MLCFAQVSDSAEHRDPASGSIRFAVYRVSDGQVILQDTMRCHSIRWHDVHTLVANIPRGIVDRSGRNYKKRYITIATEYRE
jgi:hypothetical protein